jgi:subtilisin family serine protease
MSAATPAPSTSISPESAFTCPTSATTSSNLALGRSGTASSRRLARAIPAAAKRSSSTLLAVTYRTSTGTTATRLMSVDATKLSTTASQVRAQSGVIDAQAVQYRYPLTTNPYLTNDPYFRGETGAVAPLYQTASTDGQWDMHVMELEHAFAYSQPNNGSGITSANALGSPTIKLAVIDTGVDVTHPDLAGSRIVRTKCFLTDQSGTSSNGTIITDEDGHGTDVTGIASASTGNDFGFAGAGGNVSLMLYRVFPTPDDNCTNDQSNDPQCGAADVDIASAINDAVANGANVINMSFGGGTCTGGKDPDTVEGTAISNALSHDVIIVAAAGNAGGAGLDAPACDTGVIAVGASAYNDGQPNASNYTGANKEYVATSYSQYGSTNVAKSTSSWGVVAPGGDATSTSDSDNLHWIENIWTSTPFDSNFAAYDDTCTNDIFSEKGDCQTFIDGTSMSAAHVSGAAALVLSVSGSTYDTPTAMFRLLCTTADDISDPHEGCGRVNVYRAVATALGDPNLP